MLLNYDELIERLYVDNTQEAANTHSIQNEFFAFQMFKFFERGESVFVECVSVSFSSESESGFAVFRSRFSIYWVDVQFLSGVLSVWGYGT